jgi:hypothetical protein
MFHLALNANHPDLLQQVARPIFRFGTDVGAAVALPPQGRQYNCRPNGMHMVRNGPIPDRFSDWQLAYLYPTLSGNPRSLSQGRSVIQYRQGFV